MKSTIQFSPPDISESEIQEVAAALRSGWITTGPRAKLLEQKIAAWIGTAKCACLNSQTACAELALRIMGIGPGDEVITTAYTYTATASVVCHVGAKLILIDTQKDKFEMDYNAVEAAITERTKAIIPVDLGGIPCDYDRIFAVAEGRKSLFKPANEMQSALGRVAVMADTAHAFGASRHGIMVGNIADFSSFSFHAVKNFTTAEGGALTWRTISGIKNEDIYHQIQLLSLHGQSKDALAKTKLGSWEYDIIGLWYKCNMTDIMASIGLAQFNRYPEMLAKRKKIIERYDAVFKPLGIQVLNHTKEYQSSGHLYLVRIPQISSEQRDKIIIQMAANGIICNVHYKPLPMMTAYKNMGFDINNYPYSYDKFHNLISLPLHTGLTEEDVDYIIDTFIKIIKISL